MHITLSVTVERPPYAVFAYLADFATTEQWDSGVVRTTRAGGDAGVGTTHRNGSRFRLWSVLDSPAP